LASISGWIANFSPLLFLLAMRCLRKKSRRGELPAAADLPRID